MWVRGARLDELQVLQEIERAAGALFREIGMPEIADDEPLPIGVLAGYVTADRAWVAVEPESPRAIAKQTIAKQTIAKQTIAKQTIAKQTIAKQTIAKTTGAKQGSAKTTSAKTTGAKTVGGKTTGAKSVAADGAGAGAGAEGAGVLGYLIADLVDGNVHVEQVSVDPRFSRRGIGRLLLDHAAVYGVGVGAPALTLTTFAEVAWNAPYYRRCGFEVMADAVIMPGLRALREHEASVGLDRWPRVCMRRTLTSFG